MEELEEVTVLAPIALEAGEKIRIESGPRRGDWLVIGIDEKKLRLRCPVSGREVEWDRFCYQVEKRRQAWPLHD